MMRRGCANTLSVFGLSFVIFTATTLSACGGGEGLIRSQSTTANLSVSYDLSGVFLRAPSGADRGRTHVALTFEGLTPCTESALSSLWSDGQWRAPATFFLSAKDLTSAPPGVEVSALIKRVEREGHEVALRLLDERERSSDTLKVTQLDLEARRERLREALKEVGWSRSRPLSTIWRPPTSWLTLGGIDALSRLRSTAVLWTRAIADQDAQSTSLLRGAGEILSFSQRPDWEVDKRGETLEDGPSHDSIKCPIVERLKEFRETLNSQELSPSTVTDMLGDAVQERAGVSLLRSVRPKISRSCVDLFDLKAETDSITQADEARPRWSIVIKEDRENHRYLTLPIPYEGPLPPSVKRSKALKHLLNKRSLWWGADKCIRGVSYADVLPPTPSSHSSQDSMVGQNLAPPASRFRWVQVDLSDEDRVSIVILSRWRGAHQTLSLPSIFRALEREEVAEVSWRLRGIVGEAFPERVYLSDITPQRAIGVFIQSTLTPSERPSYEERRSAIAGYTLISAYPLEVYVSLAELSGERRFRSLAYAGVSFIGPLLYVPTTPSLTPNLSARDVPLLSSSLSDRLIEVALKRGVTLHANDFISLAPAKGGLKLSQRREVIEVIASNERGRLKAQLKALSHAQSTREVAPSMVFSVDGERALGHQRIRVIAPPGHRGQGIGPPID